MGLEYKKSLVRILVVDDEDSIRGWLTEVLKGDGWDVSSAKNGKEALIALKKKPVHIILSDINMPEMTGIELLEAVKKDFSSTEFVIMTSHATLDTAVKAVQLGAYDYLNKPFEDISVVPQKIERVAERIMLRQQNAELLKRLKLAGRDLKLLLSSIAPLSGLLDVEELFKSCLKNLPRLFDFPELKASWWSHQEGKWHCLEVNGEGEKPEPIEDIEQLDQVLTDYQKISIDLFKYDGRVADALVYENKNPNLSKAFIHQVETCYQKVMYHKEIASLANKDGLTKLYNHRYFQERIRQEFSQAKRQKSFVSLILMDVDNFKHYNDTHGHPAGDKLLKELAVLLARHEGVSGETMKRVTDIVARYGGEEFVMILPFTPYEGAKIKAERVREAIEAYAFDHADQQPLACVSVSVGVATYPDHADDPAELIQLADKALYHAKRLGRNRVVGAEDLYKKEEAKPEEQSVKTLGGILDSIEESEAAPTSAETLLPGTKTMEFDDAGAEVDRVAVPDEDSDSAADVDINDLVSAIGSAIHSTAMKAETPGIDLQIFTENLNDETKQDPVKGAKEK